VLSALLFRFGNAVLVSRSCNWKLGGFRIIIVCIRPAATNREAGTPVASTDARLSRIVRVLSDHAMVVVSGTKIAEEIGTSRSEVWRLVQQLRSLGVEIAGHPATGYRLESVPDLLLPDAIDPLVKGTIFRGHLHHYFRLGSTNRAAMEAAQAGEPEGSVYFAEEQTAGHGRGGHSWHSERSAGIYVSVILRPSISPVDVLALSLMAGLAAAAAVEEVAGVRPDLRWPNDLMLRRRRDSAAATTGATQDEERKFCGILTELNAEMTRVRYAVVGLGLNINQCSFPEELQPLATSLRMETGRTWSRVRVAAALLQSLDREYRRLKGSATAATNSSAEAAANLRLELFRRFEQASSYVRGRRVHVDEQGGYTGVTAGLNEQGFLLVRADDGPMKTVISGGVRGID